MGAAAGLLRGVILAVLFGAVAALVGAVVALVFCTTGACSAAVPVAELITTPTPGLGGAISTAAVLAVLLFLGLFLVLIPDDPVRSLATIFSALIAVLAFLLFLPRPGGVVERADEPVPEEIARAGERLPDLRDQRLDPEPSEGAFTEPGFERSEPLPACGEGTFFDGEACVPCTTTITADAPPRLTFDPVPTEAHWVYAREDLVELGSREVPLGTFAEGFAEAHRLCQAEALLVFGSASADGGRPRNDLRARNRASRLGDALRRACPSAPPVFALSLGQSEAAEDVAADRPISVVRVASLTADEVSMPVILEELGYVIAAGGPAPDLLSRRSRFPEPWRSSDGGRAALRVKTRPTETVTVPAIDAPASCRAGDLGVDGR